MAYSFYSVFEKLKRFCIRCFEINHVDQLVIVEQIVRVNCTMPHCVKLTLSILKLWFNPTNIGLFSSNIKRNTSPNPAGCSSYKHWWQVISNNVNDYKSCVHFPYNKTQFLTNSIKLYRIRQWEIRFNLVNWNYSHHNGNVIDREKVSYKFWYKCSSDKYVNPSKCSSYFIW